jgi:hypothetical protein
MVITKELLELSLIGIYATTYMRQMCELIREAAG